MFIISDVYLKAKLTVRVSVFITPTSFASLTVELCQLELK